MKRREWIMLSYKEIVELREKLANGEITQDRAKEFYWKDYKEGKRAWHTKDWKERRSEVIKDKCEICGSKETLTLQHRSHPKKYSDYEREVTKEYTRFFIDSGTTIGKREFSEHIIKNYNYAPAPLCPNCKSKHLSKRMIKIPQYLCTECRIEFDEPIYKTAEELIEIFYENEEAVEVRDKWFVSKDKYRNQHNLSQVKYWLQREMAKAKYSEPIGEEAFLRFLDANIKYLSFEDTLTACRKCAYNFDLNNMELCPKCKEYYKGVQYPTCVQCLPEDRRKAALEKIEFGKEMRAMHEWLGID
jgi:ribosomal protein L37AE/L43A